MRQGMSMTAFAQEVQRQAAVKADYKAPTGRLSMRPLLQRTNDGLTHALVMERPREGDLVFPARKLFHQQMAERCKIPWPYYERLLAQPEGTQIFEQTVNYWLHEQEEIRLVRTLDGRARAYLGDKYRPLDNIDLFKAVAPVVFNPGHGMRIESVEITETRFYIKAFSDRITGEVRRGDIVQSGVVISNSEVGHGQISIEPAYYRLVCLNGMIRPDSSLKRRHVGRASGDLESVEQFFSDSTLRADDEAFWRKVVDVVSGTFQQAAFDTFLEKMRAATDVPIGPRPLPEVQRVVQQRYGLSDTEGDRILRALSEGGDFTQWGLANAITNTAQVEELSYDRATELERIGGMVIELPQREFAHLIG